jgi:predicted nucleic acid-binding protein
MHPAESVATAKLAYAEVYAALMRRRREGHVSAGQYALAYHQFEGEWPTYVRIDLRDDILLAARMLIQRHPLKGSDAIHLASALDLKTTSGAEIVFAAADRQLLRAARGEHLQTLDVESGDR